MHVEFLINQLLCSRLCTCACKPEAQCTQHTCRTLYPLFQAPLQYFQNQIKIQNNYVQQCTVHLKSAAEYPPSSCFFSQTQFIYLVYHDLIFHLKAFLYHLIFKPHTTDNPLTFKMFVLVHCRGLVQCNEFYNRM